MYAACDDHYGITTGECGGYPVYHSRNRTDRMILRSSRKEKWACAARQTLVNCRVGLFALSSTTSDHVQGQWDNVNAICTLP